MRTIVLGNKEIGLKATPLALLFYKQEFGADLIGDLTKMSGVEKDLSKLDIVVILQMVWAMNKAYNGLGKAFPPFTKWLEEIESIDVTDPEFIGTIMAEAEDGFFRRAGGQAKSANK